MMGKFVKYFMFWTITIVVVALAMIMGVDSILDGSANAILDGVLIIVLIATAYFVFCEIIRD